MMSNFSNLVTQKLSIKSDQKINNAQFKIPKYLTGISINTNFVAKMVRLKLDNVQKLPDIFIRVQFTNENEKHYFERFKTITFSTKAGEILFFSPKFKRKRDILGLRLRRNVSEESNKNWDQDAD